MFDHYDSTPDTDPDAAHPTEPRPCPAEDAEGHRTPHPTHLDGDPNP